MDIWDDEGTEPSQSAHIERAHNNQGYLDGVTRAKEANLQPGFDNGYPHGAEIGLKAGRIVGTLQGMGLTDLEAAAVKELDVAVLFSYEYYDKNARPLFHDEHPLILKWQKIVNDFNFEHTGDALK